MTPTAIPASAPAPARAVIASRLRERVERLLDGRYRGDRPLATLRLLLRGSERRLGAAFLLYVVKMSPLYLVPQATQHIVDALTRPSAAATHRMLVWIAIMAVAIAQNIPVHTAYANLMSAAMRDAQRDLRSALVMRLQQLSIAFHSDTDSGRLQTKLLRDVDNIGAVITSAMNSVVPTLVVIVYALVQAFRLSPMVAVFFIVCAPAACSTIYVFREKLRDRNQKFRREMESVSVRMTEMIEMLPVTRAHAAEAGETARMRRQLARLTASARRMDVVTERFGASSWVTFQSFQVLCLCFCAWLVARHQLTVGELVMFQAYFGMIVGQVNATVGLLPQLTAGAESIRSIGEVLESPQIERDDDKYAPAEVRGGIAFESVSYTYPGASEPAVDDFTLRVHPGEVVALVGASGSGKSTLLNLVIGFRRVQAGRMLIDGVDSADLNFRAFRRHLAIVPQTTTLFSGSIRDNMTYGLDGVTDAQLRRALDRANCSEFVDRMPDGVDSRIGPRGGRLSGGQRQRVAIARALLRDPSLLILDEATSALDAHSEHLVQQAIEELIAGRTALIIAHRLSTLRAADRIVVLEHGRIIEQGRWDELLSRPDTAFARAYALQNEGPVGAAR